MTEHRTPYEAGTDRKPANGLPCGHCPQAGSAANTCIVCQAEYVARHQERRRCRDLAMEIAASLRNCDIATEASLAAERVAREIMDEGSQDG